MAEDQVEEIKRKIDIVELVSSYVPLKKAGRNHKALCPFHSEKTPSFMVSPELQIFKCFGCFPAGSLICTNPSLKPIEEIRTGEKVLTHRGKYQKVQRVFERPYEGKLIKVRVRKIREPVLLTEDHKVFVIKTKSCRHKGRRTRLCQWNCNRYCPTPYFKEYKIEKIPAGHLSKNDFLLYPVIKKEKDIKFINLASYITKVLPPHGTKPRKINYEIPVDENFLKLLGYYIAEGSSHRAYIRFSLGEHEEDFVKEIKKLIEKLFGLKSSTHRRKEGERTGLEITCCHSFLANIFENLCGRHANGKHIPFVFQHLPAKKQKVLLEAIFRGGGYTTKKGVRSRAGMKIITTVSPLLANQLKDILLRLGYQPSFWTLPAYSRKGVNHQKSFTLAWRGDLLAHYSHFYKTKDGLVFWLLPIKELEELDFRGDVYNLMIEKDHSYVANNFVVGNCGKGGDAYAFIQEIEGVEFGEALRMLADRVGVKLKSFRPSPKQERRQRLFKINHLAAEFFHHLLTSHRFGKKALDYLHRRGLGDEVIKKFSLGYAPRSWDSFGKFLLAKRYSLSDLLASGLAIQKEGGRGFYDRFRGRIIFPIKDLRGRVVGFSGRRLTEDENEPKYINTPETLIFAKGRLLYGLDLAKKAIKRENLAIVVEGQTDVLTPFQAGTEDIVASLGTALTYDQVRLLKRFTGNIAICFDADLAGDSAARRGIELAEEAGISVRVLSLPSSFKDPDECIRKDPQAWEKALNELTPVYDFLLVSALKKYGAEEASGKKKVLNELLPILRDIPSEVVKDHYVKKLAEKLEVGERAVRLDLERLGLRESEPVAPLDDTSLEVPSRQRSLEERALRLPFFLPLKEAKMALRKIAARDFTDSQRAELFTIIKKHFLRRKRAVDAAIFRGRLKDKLSLSFEAVYFKDEEEKPVKELKEELEAVVKALKKQTLKRELEALGLEIKRAEKEGKGKELKKLQKRFLKASAKLKEDL